MRLLQGEGVLVQAHWLAHGGLRAQNTMGRDVAGKQSDVLFTGLRGQMGKGTET